MVGGLRKSGRALIESVAGRAASGFAMQNLEGNGADTVVLQDGCRRHVLSLADGADEPRGL
jgi:hypothetical protein